MSYLLALKMARSFTIFVCVSFCCLAVASCGGSVTQSHIDGNVPEQRDFNHFLQRDLDSYFKSNVNKPVSVSWDLLRHGATQTGISYPKFYAWVKVTHEKKLIDEGAVRLEAINKQAFEVTHFISVSQMRKDPSSIRDVFPAALCDGIQKRANDTPKE